MLHSDKINRFEIAFAGSRKSIRKRAAAGLQGGRALSSQVNAVPIRCIGQIGLRPDAHALAAPIRGDLERQPFSESSMMEEPPSPVDRALCVLFYVEEQSSGQILPSNTSARADSRARAPLLGERRHRWNMWVCFCRASR